MQKIEAEESSTLDAMPKCVEKEVQNKKLRHPRESLEERKRHQDHLSFLVSGS
jgi:hypothetical protein